MSLLLTISKIYVPGFIQSRKLDMLFAVTADAFQTAVPSTKELSFEERLKIYALLTRTQALEAIKQGREQEIQIRLFQNACRLGQQIRTRYNIKTTGEVMQMATIIYKLIKIDFRGEPAGNILIKKCFFSAYYPANVCKLISSFDAGLLAGLSGGGKLSFSQRITEGKGCCVAHLERAGE